MKPSVVGCDSFSRHHGVHVSKEDLNQQQMVKECLLYHNPAWRGSVWQSAATSCSAHSHWNNTTGWMRSRGGAWERQSVRVTVKLLPHRLLSLFQSGHGFSLWCVVVTDGELIHIHCSVIWSDCLSCMSQSEKNCEVSKSGSDMKAKMAAQRWVVVIKCPMAVMRTFL